MKVWQIILTPNRTMVYQALLYQIILKFIEIPFFGAKSYWHSSYLKGFLRRATEPFSIKT